MTKLSSMVLSAALIALPVSSMAAYEGGDVKDGGTISGTVKFKGTAPAPKKLDVSKDKEVCGKTPKTDESLVVIERQSCKRGGYDHRHYQREKRWR